MNRPERDSQFLRFVGGLTERQREWLDRHKPQPGTAEYMQKAAQEVFARHKAHQEAIEAKYPGRAWEQKMLRQINRNKIDGPFDHDKQFEKDTGEDLDVNPRQASGGSTWLP